MAIDNSYRREFICLQRHTQLVLRTRSRSFPVPGSSNRRYVSLTCLVCNTIVYRVEQAISADVEGKEGPVLPSPDWAEQEILKSPTGFIELHKGCIVRYSDHRIGPALRLCSHFDDRKVMRLLDVGYRQITTLCMTSCSLQMRPLEAHRKLLP